MIATDEYLSTCYRPDCEYLDGMLLERNTGEYNHSTVQTAIAALINIQGVAWGVRARVELRVNVRAGRYRVPDVVVMDRRRPPEQIVTRAPLLCVEVLSPEDRMSEMDERVTDYLDMGVPCIWILDSARRRAFVRTAAGAVEAQGVLRAPGTSIELPLADVFAELA